MERLNDKDVTFQFTPERVRQVWKLAGGPPVDVDDDTLRDAALEVVSSKVFALVTEIVELAKDYEEAQSLQHLLREQYLESSKADPWPDP